MKTLIALIILLVAIPAFASDHVCPNGEGNGIFLFRGPQLIRPYMGQMKEYGNELAKIGASKKLSATQLASIKTISNEMDNLNEMDGQNTCFGDLFSWNARDEIPYMDAMYVIDVTTGQKGWAEMTFFLKYMVPTQAQ